jgi:hypothetical protein
MLKSPVLRLFNIFLSGMMFLTLVPESTIAMYAKAIEIFYSWQLLQFLEFVAISIIESRWCIGWGF